MYVKFARKVFFVLCFQILDVMASYIQVNMLYMCVCIHLHIYTQYILYSHTILKHKENYCCPLQQSSEGHCTFAISFVHFDDSKDFWMSYIFNDEQCCLDELQLIQFFRHYLTHINPLWSYVETVLTAQLCLPVDGCHNINDNFSRLLACCILNWKRKIPSRTGTWTRAFSFLC